MKGAAWEFQLERWALEYRAHGVVVAKTSPEAKLIKGRMVYTRKGLPDFVGVMRGGRAIVFDAKEVSAGDRFPWSHLPVHQARELQMWHDLGALAFLAVRFKSLGANCILPWGTAETTRYFNEERGSFTRSVMLPMTERGWLDWALGLEVP
jgi:recombination protein U